METTAEMFDTGVRRMSRSMLAVLAGAVLVLSAVAPRSAVAETKGFDGPSTDVSMTDLVPEMSSSESYSERYTFKSNLDNGGYVEVRFTISNLGLYDGHGKAEVKVRWPDRPDYKFSKKYGSDEWSYDKKSFMVTMGNTRIRGKGENTFVMRHTGSHEGKKLEFEIELDSEIPMWTPGKITSGESYYRVHFASLQSNASGTISFGDESHSIEGTDKGYGEHARTNVAPFSLANRISTSRKYEDDPSVFFIWRELQLTEDYGGGTEAFLVVGYDNQIVFSDVDPETKHARHKKDPKGGYRVPQALEINGENGDDSVKLVLEADDMDRKDLLAGRGRLVRMAASALTSPYHYYMSGTYGLQMEIQGTKASVRGKTGYVIDCFNE